MIIDGVNISQYGVYIVQNGLNNVVEYPSIKAPDNNDWAEMDGIEVDLSKISLEPKKITIKFAGSGCFGFINTISQSGYRTVVFDEIGITKTLRVVSVSDLSANLIVMFSVDFYEDSPVIVQSNPTHASTGSGFELDGVDLSRYGVVVLEGSIDSILKPFPVKQNRSISLKGISGQTYNANRVKFAEKQVDVNCLMTGSDFITNYNALFYALTKSGERTFYYNGIDYTCYYNSSKVSEFEIINGRFWFKFTLSFTFIKGVQR